MGDTKQDSSSQGRTMGCASSTEVIIDPVTGEQKTKKKLGGAYPGQRLPQHNQYAPTEFNNGQATAHFIQYGGGNALVLVDGPSPTSVQPQHGQQQPEFISVTLPDGVYPGDTIHVQAPDGRLNAIIVPEGMYAGSTFTVQFDPGAQSAPPPPSSKYENPPVASATPLHTYEPQVQSSGANHGGADDFATGFGR